MTLPTPEPAHHKTIIFKATELPPYALPLATFIYILVAHLSLKLALMQSSASPIWPPTGLAIALVLCFGYRMLPAVFIGATAVNAWAGGLASAWFIGIGNMLEAGVAVYLVRRLCPLSSLFQTLNGGIIYTLMAGLLSPLISATMGVTALWASHQLSSASFGATWMTWWTGDVGGALVIGPILIYVFSAKKALLAQAAHLRWLPMSLVTLAGSIAVFRMAEHGTPLCFAIMPIFILSALVLSLPEALAQLLICSIVLVVGTLHGTGPFALLPINTGLILAQSFITVSAITILILNATCCERGNMTRHLQNLTAELENSLRRLQQTGEEKEEALRNVMQMEKLASLGSMVAGVAHELNTPIGNNITLASAIRDYVHTLTLSASSGTMIKTQLFESLADISDAAKLIQKSSQRAADLIEKFKQIAVDQASMRRRTFRLSSLASDLVQTMQPQIKNCSWQLKLDIAQNIELNSYPGALDQVLTNLIDNACIHAFDNGAEGLICISGQKEGNSAMIMVEDNGLGIDAPLLSRIFEPFFTTRLGQGGSGLGLYIVFNLVNHVLGGTIEVESQPLRGSRFILRLPLTAPLQSAHPLNPYAI